MESEPTRKTPNFNTELAYSEIRGGVFRILIFLLLIYVVVSFLFRASDPETLFTYWYRWILPLLCFVSMPVLYVGFFTIRVAEGLSVIRGKERWLRSATQGKAVVVDKRTREDWEDREDYCYQVSICELKLRYTPTLTVNDAGERALWVRVSCSDYEKYEPGDAVNIFYSIADPSLFLLEGE